MRCYSLILRGRVAYAWMWINVGLAMLALLNPASLSARPPQNFSVLLYSSPDRYHNQALPKAVDQFERLAEKHFFRLDWTQRPEDLNEANLERYEVVVFLYSNARELGPEAIASLKSHLLRGRGFVGVHSSSVDSQQDLWFKRMIGRSFVGHPEKQTGALTVVEPDFPACMHLPARWLWTDEWYEFGPELSPGLKVVLAVDETSYAPLTHQDENGEVRVGMAGRHPIAWYHEFGGGRVFYTALGHLEIAYDDPWFQGHLYGAIYWAATGWTAEREEKSKP